MAAVARAQCLRGATFEVMCDTRVLVGLVIAAEVAFLIALGCVTPAILTSTNFFTSGGSAVLLGIALGGVLTSAGLIGTAITKMGAAPQHRWQ